MKQQEASMFPCREGWGIPLPLSVHACYRAIRGRPPFEKRWIWEREIERGVSNIKRSDWDKWFRCEWYKAGARRKWPQWKRERRAPQASRRCPAWR